MKRAGLRIGLCTGGGDCPGLNAALRAIVRHAIGTHGMEIIGIRDGLTGLMSEPPAAGPVGLADVAGILETGGTILGTSNKGSPFRERAEAQRSLTLIQTAWKALRLDALIVVGGDGTHFMAKQLVKAGLPVVGVPKTIDNDLHGTEQTIGFSTAVEVAADAAVRLRTSAEAHNRIMVLEVMGRDAGHIALATGLASGANAVLLPEIPFRAEVLEAWLARRRSTGRNAFLIVAAEGAHAEGAAASFQQAASGARILGGIGNAVASMLSHRTGVDARVAVLGHVQRGGQPNAADRVLAAILGTRAVDLVVAGKFGRIVGIRAGALVEISYRTIMDSRRLVDPDDPTVAAAEAVGICLGRESAYRAPS